MTFNTLISACGKAGKYDEALQLFAKMGDRGLQPDNFTVRVSANPMLWYPWPDGGTRP